MASRRLKRTCDVLIAAVALVMLSPVLLLVGLAVWFWDFRTPFYLAPRAAKGGEAFLMVKFRSMEVGADRDGVDSTSATDPRVTPVGRCIRNLKVDELPELWNVLRGQMSIVGPRPQVMREVQRYTATERALLSVRPGITDLASIVFFDEGDVLQGHFDADLAYNQLIRPWKSRLGLVYVEHASLRLDLEIISMTAVALVSRPMALAWVSRVLARLGVDLMTREAARRRAPLAPWPPPGASDVVSQL